MAQAICSALYASTNSLRSGMLYLAFVIALPVVLLHFFVDVEKGMVAAGRKVCTVYLCAHYAPLVW